MRVGIGDVGGGEGGGSTGVKRERGGEGTERWRGRGGVA